MWRPLSHALCVLSLLTLADRAGAAEPAPAVMKELRRVQASVLKGEGDAIRIEYSEKAKERPGDPMPRVYLAWLALPSDDAWNQLKAIAAIFPDNPWVHFGMGRIYVKWKMKDQARAEVDWLLKKDARFYPALMLQGELAALQEDWAAAVAQYQKALAQEDDPEARAGLGLALLKAGQKDEALAQLKKSTQAYPEQPAALAALVPLLVEAKDPEAARAAQAAVDLRPKDREARRVLADLELEAGDKVGAAKAYDALVKLGNPEPVVLKRLAELYREAGEGADEDRVLAALAAADPAGAEAPLRRAELKVQAKDLAGAEAQLKEALKREPSRADAQGRLGKVLLDQGRSVEALEAYRRLRALAPSDGPAKAQVEALEAGFRLPKKPLRGGVNSVYWVLSGSLDKLYAERRAARPALAGKLKLKVHIGADGAVTAVEVIEDSLQDQPLLGHVYFTLRDATYTEKKVEPVIEFDLGKAK
jgi:tetratricopeptide (TPR) repeat protein